MRKTKQSDAKTERKQLKKYIRSIRLPPTPTQIHTHTHAQHLDINIMQTDTHIQHTLTHTHLSLSSLLSKKQSKLNVENQNTTQKSKRHQAFNSIRINSVESPLVLYFVHYNFNI